jgi:hypothetical protein
MPKPTALTTVGEVARKPAAPGTNKQRDQYDRARGEARLAALSKEQYQARYEETISDLSRRYPAMGRLLTQKGSTSADKTIRGCPQRRWTLAGPFASGESQTAEFYSCPGLGAQHGLACSHHGYVIRNGGLLWVRVEAFFCQESSSGVQTGEPDLPKLQTLASHVAKVANSFLSGFES